MSEILYITRKGAGVPMRVRVVRARPYRWTRSAARNLRARGVPLWAIAWRLKISRATAARFVADEPARDAWREAVRAAVRELVEIAA